MDKGFKTCPPCLATRAGSRPPDVCRVSSTTPSRSAARCYVRQARCRKCDAAGKTHFRTLAERKQRH